MSYLYITNPLLIPQILLLSNLIVNIRDFKDYNKYSEKEDNGVEELIINNYKANITYIYELRRYFKEKEIVR